MSDAESYGGGREARVCRRLGVHRWSRRQTASFVIFFFLLALMFDLSLFFFQSRE